MGPLMRVGVQFICMNTSLAASHTTPSMNPGTSTEYRLDSAISTCQTIPCSEQDKVRASSVVGSIPPRAIPSHPAVLPTPRTQCSSTMLPWQVGLQRIDGDRKLQSPFFTPTDSVRLVGQPDCAWALPPPGRWAATTSWAQRV